MKPNVILLNISNNDDFSDCRYIEIRTFEFVAETQIHPLLNKKNVFMFSLLETKCYHNI